MSEAIISRRGTKKEDPTASYVYRMQMYTSSNMFTAPNATNNTFHITMIGGGGGGQSSNYGSGGGSGWMNAGDVALNYGEIVSITVGGGGDVGQAGGSSSFGSYLSANGGEAGRDVQGGNGGAGGGGGASAGGGIGFQFGGGGGGCTYISDINDMYSTYQGFPKSYAKGGDAGPWGGGGGSGGYHQMDSHMFKYWFGYDRRNYSNYANHNFNFPSNSGENVSETCRENFFKRYGNGGIYGGNGGGPVFFWGNNNGVWDNSKPQSGTNTSGWNNVNTNYQGYGLAGSRFGWTTVENSSENYRQDWDDYKVVNFSGAGGGGGYGGNGGSSQEGIRWSYSGAGGGGGYGANGGNGSWGWYASVGVGDIRGGDGYGGGGGGYGCDGKDATNNQAGRNLGYKGGGGGGGFGNIPGIGSTFGSGGNVRCAGDGGIILIEYYGE